MHCKEKPSGKPRIQQAVVMPRESFIWGLVTKLINLIEGIERAWVSANTRFTKMS